MGPNDVLSEIAERIKTSTATVRERVVAALAEKEIAQRVDALTAALAKLEDARRDGRKIKPDIETFDADGKLVSSSYSKAKLDELKKNRELVERIETAITKGLEGDFGKVREVK